MSGFSRLVIIYNPHSTGDSPAKAKQFFAEARRAFPHLPADLLETDHAGHARTLAYEAACKIPQTLIVSVSGDGGYHEVINGAMQAIDERKGSPICAVLPGGNANDHYQSVSKRPLLEAMRDAKIEHMDVLAVRFAGHTRYAHSYIGLGLTPLVAIELNRHSLSAFHDIWLSLKAFWKFRPFTIELDNTRRSFDSLVIGNINRMAKHLTLAEQSSIKDGTFEVIIWPHSPKARLLLMLLKSALGRGAKPARRSQFSFRTVQKTLVQMDGEVVALEPYTKVVVSSAHGKLRTIR